MTPAPFNDSAQMRRRPFRGRRNRRDSESLWLVIVDRRYFFCCPPTCCE